MNYFDHRLCKSFYESAHWVHERLTTAYELGMPFNEETITESILLYLSERNYGGGFSIKAYTKNEEGSGETPTGADWSFWFADTKGKGIELRIQAKRLYLDKGTYGALDGREQQYKNLISNSGNAIPLYVFYNSADKIDKYFRDYSCIYDFYPYEFWGCTYASPISIPSKKAPRPSEIKPMYPWHTLVCGFYPDCNNSHSLPECVASAVEKVYTEANRSSFEEDEVRKRLYDLEFSADQKAPEWVQLLLNQEHGVASDDPSDGSTSELEDFLEKNNLKGVVYISEKSE